MHRILRDHMLVAKITISIPVFCIPFACLAAIDCSLLDPRARVSTEIDARIGGSLGTLFRIAKVDATIEGKVKEEIDNLQRGSPPEAQIIIVARTLYLFCGMVANAKDISTDRKVELFRTMLEVKQEKSPNKEAMAAKPPSRKNTQRRESAQPVGAKMACPILDELAINRRIEQRKYQLITDVMLEFRRTNDPGVLSKLDDLRYQTFLRSAYEVRMSSLESLGDPAKNYVEGIYAGMAYVNQNESALLDRIKSDTGKENYHLRALVLPYKDFEEVMFPAAEQSLRKQCYKQPR